jgi:hypothetical protein
MAIIAKTFGYNPTDVTAPREARTVVDLANNVSDEQKTAIVDRLVKAVPADRKKIYADIMLYNKHHPHDPIQGSTISRRFSEQARINARPEVYRGLHLSRRDVPGAEQLGRFAR